MSGVDQDQSIAVVGKSHSHSLSPSYQYEGMRSEALIHTLAELNNLYLFYSLETNPIILHFLHLFPSVKRQT